MKCHVTTVRELQPSTNASLNMMNMVFRRDVEICLTFRAVVSAWYYPALKDVISLS